MQSSQNIANDDVEPKKVEGSHFNVAGYWEPWHTPTNPGSGTTSDASYYENDFKNMDRVIYAFLTLDSAPNPDKPNDKYWDDACLYDVETRDCVSNDIEWPAKWPNPDAWNAVKIEAMYQACKYHNKKWIWGIGGASDLIQAVHDDDMDDFTDKVANLLTQVGDGVDLDFEHISDGVYRLKFAKLLYKLRQKLDKLGLQDKLIGYTTRYNAAWVSTNRPEGWTAWSTDGEALTINSALKD